MEGTRGRLRTAREVVVALYTGLLLAAALGRADMAETIARAEHSPLREATLAVLAPRVAPPPPGYIPLPPLPPLPPRRDEDVATAAVAAVPEHPPWWREISAADPLRVWVAGDSLLNMTAPELERRLEATGRVTVRPESRPSTGLVRPDHFDWQRRFERVLAATPRPDVVVLMLGANDSQTMMDDRQRLDRNTAPWVEAYTRRVEALMDTAEAAGVRLYWVGLPAMRLERRHQTATLINPRIAQAAAAREGVRYVSTWETFAGEDGAYRWWGLDEQGHRVALRDADGAHFTLSGAVVLAELLLAEIDAEWGVMQDAAAEETPTAASDAASGPSGL